MFKQGVLVIGDTDSLSAPVDYNISPLLIVKCSYFKAQVEKHCNPLEKHCNPIVTEGETL
jgi:hypothetical protein